MREFKVTYLSGQSLIFLGDSIEEVTAFAEATIAKFKIGRPHVGIAKVEAVTK